MSRRILIVEDDAHLAEGLRLNMELDGYDPVVASNAEDGLRYWERGGVDLILLDVMLPGMDGFELCRRIRDKGDRVPVLFLTAKGGEDDRVRGLEEGGDDYITKPFVLRELLARIKGIFRREDWMRERPVKSVLEWTGVRVDLDAREADAPSGRHRLKEKEAMILRLLAERDGEVVDRDTIIDRIWGYDAYPSTRTVDNFILALRKMLEVDPSRPERILTAHGKGYRLKL